MLQIAGSDLLPKQHVDGYSYLRALQGESYTRPPFFCYKWQTRPDSTGDTRSLSLIDGRFKIIEWIDEDLIELFNLSDDPGEHRNLASEMPDLAQSMLRTLRATEQSIGDLREDGRKGVEKRMEKFLKGSARP